MESDKDFEDRIKKAAGKDANVKVINLHNPMKANMPSPLFSKLFRTIVYACAVSNALLEFTVWGVIGLATINALAVLLLIFIIFRMDTLCTKIIANRALEGTLMLEVLKMQKQTIDKYTNLYGTFSEDEGLTTDPEETDGNQLH